MDSSQHLLLAQVASMYYEQEMTQNAIAAELGLSRVKVYRLLKQAREQDIVQIKISWPVERNASLEQAFKEAFGLKEALVLRTTATHIGQIIAQLGRLAAQYLETILEDDMTLAICLGRSTYAVINAISSDFQVKVRVAQAMGIMPGAIPELDNAAMARQLAQKLGGEMLYLSSPLIADSLEAAAMLRGLRDIRRTLDAAGQAEVALVGIGSLDPHNSGFSKAGFIPPEELTALVEAGAVGDMVGQLFTRVGELHPSPHNQRVIGISFEDLRRIPTVLAVAAGSEKGQAILGALHTETINVFCTDEQTARAVLSLKGA